MFTRNFVHAMMAVAVGVVFAGESFAQAQKAPAKAEKAPAKQAAAKPEKAPAYIVPSMPRKRIPARSTIVSASLVWHF